MNRSRTTINWKFDRNWKTSHARHLVTKSNDDTRARRLPFLMLLLTARGERIVLIDRGNRLIRIAGIKHTRPRSGIYLHLPGQFECVVLLPFKDQIARRRRV